MYALGFMHGIDRGREQVSTGWADETRPAMNARNLARVRRPWSRDFLIREGRAALAHYYEHGGERPPLD